MGFFEIAAWFLAVFFSFVAVFYTFRLKAGASTRQFLGKSGTQHWFGHMAFRFFRVLIWLVCVVRIPFNQVDQYLFLYDTLMQPTVVYSGMALMAAGFSLTVAGHFSLGEAWTSGINPEGPTEIMQTGIYHVSRNPMFIGVLVTQFGFFLTLPGGFTTLCLVIGYTAVLNQVKLEEQYLKSRFGQRYQDYTREVPRWLGKASFKF